MTTRFVVPVLLLVFAAPLAAEAQQVGRIDGRTFVVQKITGAGIPWAPRTMFGRPLHVTFSERELRFRANTGCNTLMGDYAIVDGAFVLNQAGSTLMACINREAEQLEVMLGAFLRSSPRLSLDGDRLVFESSSVRLEALDWRIVNPDRPLVGTTWLYNSEIHAVGGGGAVVNVTVPTLVLASDGTFIYQGCQRIGGRYEQAGGRFTLLPGPGTGSPCADQRAAELERRIIGMLLDRALTATIRGGSLSLLRDDGAGVVFTELAATLRQ